LHTPSHDLRCFPVPRGYTVFPRPPGSAGGLCRRCWTRLLAGLLACRSGPMTRSWGFSP
jgi:hypothetical protein